MNHNLDTIDKLVEFGMGLSLSQQMMNTLKQTPSPAYTPPKQQPEYIYHVIIENRQVGPVTSRELSELIKNKKVTQDSLMWHPGLPAWLSAREIKEVNKLLVLNSTL